MIVDVIVSADLYGLSTNDLDTFYRLHEYRLTGVQDRSLGHGTTGHVVTYAGQGSRNEWRALYWDWPVRSPAGLRYERIVVSAAENAAALTSPQLERFAREFIDAEGR